MKYIIGIRFRKNGKNKLQFSLMLTIMQEIIRISIVNSAMNKNYKINYFKLQIILEKFKTIS